MCVFVQIHYSENLSEDKWMAAVEDGNLEEVLQVKRERALKRELKRKRIDDDDDDDLAGSDDLDIGFSVGGLEEVPDVRSLHKKDRFYNGDSHASYASSPTIDPILSSSKKRGRKLSLATNDGTPTGSSPAGTLSKKRRHDDDSCSISDPLNPQRRAVLNVIFKECLTRIRSSVSYLPDGLVFFLLSLLILMELLGSNAEGLPFKNLQIISRKILLI